MSVILARRGLAGLLAAMLWSPGGALAVEVAPHKAVYDLSLGRTSGGSEVADVSGVMTYEFADACDGWTVSQRSAMTFVYNNGEEVQLGWSMVSWESKDGLKYRFYARQMQSGQEKEEFRGEARLNAVGDGGEANYTSPSSYKVELPPGTLFPTAHSIKLLQQAGAGAPLMWAMIFDGSDAEGLFGINAFFGRQAMPGQGVATNADPLTRGPSRHVELAFFAAGGQAAEPEHEQRLQLHDNGVVTDWRLDYADFEVAAKLAKIESVPRPSC
jgi:hypothetical protein